ncbi:ZrgA family zinc uptake protein [Aquimonas voraii]|uniref:DUF2796 domain-containing protein n=1 Tax=Aquimonas voraii TaxID=265719 RepID=A0A1G6WU34_9GAMM|nr:DUF2796 domain-containing protein [Aquimonas voraii]SDD68707.1 Protein of unknown function [Aquimonas voraii]
MRTRLPRLHPSSLLLLACALPGLGLAQAHGDHAHEPAPAGAAPREQGAHEHGAARLDVALSGGTLELQIEGAAYGFVGFERAPEGAEEVARVEQARLLLNNPSALYGWEPAAGCTVQSARIDADLPEAAGASNDHDHDHDHAHEHAHEGHDHGHGGHSSWRVYHRFECSRPEALGAIEVRLFQHFSKLERIDYQLVTDTAQDGGRLAPGQSVIRLQP